MFEHFIQAINTLNQRVTPIGGKSNSLTHVVINGPIISFSYSQRHGQILIKENFKMNSDWIKPVRIGLKCDISVMSDIPEFKQHLSFI